MTEIRHDWSLDQALELYTLPFVELLYQAQTVHRQHFDPKVVQISTLLSVKTGACPEDCAYCPQSGRFKNTEVEKQSLLCVEEVIENAKAAKANGASRFLMGASLRYPPKKDFPKIIEMVKAVKELGLETCVTLGMLDDEQSQQLKEAGLDFYNHNLDSSPEFYKTIITSRTYEDRLQTLQRVRDADIKVCCGGIVGMGETREDRIGLLLQLANLPQHPESVPINRLISSKGTPMENMDVIDNFEFIRTVSTARIMMPKSVVRLSAGRDTMNEEMQALCFLAGANSIFYGDKLLTQKNPGMDKDQELFQKLGLVAQR
jgi:biotin synthase